MQSGQTVNYWITPLVREEELHTTRGHLLQLHKIGFCLREGIKKGILSKDSAPFLIWLGI